MPAGWGVEGRARAAPWTRVLSVCLSTALSSVAAGGSKVLPTASRMANSVLRGETLRGLYVFKN